MDRELTLEAIRSFLYTESIKNINDYISFINDSNKSLYSTYLRQYIIYKNYNNQYGDIAPLILANALSVTIIILNEDADNSVNQISIEPRIRSTHKIFVHRKQDHFNGIKYTSASISSRQISEYMATPIVDGGIMDTAYSFHTPPSTGNNNSLIATTQPALPGPKPRLTYSSEDLHKLSGSQHRISRQTRKKLFQYHLWKPKITTRPYDTNNSVHPKLLKSFHKSNIFQQSPIGLTLATVNTCSIRNKTDDFINHVIESDYDACFITETWLQDHNTIDNAIQSTLNTETHNFISCPRTSTTRGGGIGIFYKKNLKINIIQQHIYSTFEMCLCNIQAKASNFLVMCVYRPPYSAKNRNTISMFTAEFADICSSILSIHSDRKLIIVGDFNIHMDETNNTETIAFSELLNTLNWQQHVNEATHTSGHIIDLCITSDNSELTISQPTVDYFISDHAFISFNTKIQKPPVHKTLVKTRALSRINDENLRKDLINLSDKILSSNTMDVTHLSTIYDQKLTQILDKHAPLKSKFIIPRTCVAWFNIEAKTLKAKVRKQEKAWRKTKDPTELLRLKNIRRSYRHLIHSNKVTHFNKSIKEAKGNSRQLFAITMGLMGKTKSNQLPASDDDKSLADDFANYFITKIEKIREALSKSPSYTPQRNINSSLTTFHEVDKNTVSKLLQTSKPTTCETDPIPTKLLKSNSDIIADLITKIINRSIQQSTFCENWKLATVKPLLKKTGLDLELNNYRPVSNLSYISKIAEKVVISQLNQYLQQHNLHSNHQSAYKQCFSTETALCALVNQLLWSLEQGKVTVIVALDLSAAFDTVDHDILINVLHSCFAISGKALEWFVSYLKDRKLNVRIRNSESETKCFNFSVPQGSCLGPVLFNLYCSTITECISSGQNLGGYADDHCLIDSYDPRVPSEEERCTERIETTLGKIGNWMAANKLKMNPTKTETIMIASKASLEKANLQSIKVDQDEVTIANHLKYLGVWLDSNLSMDKHITTKCNSASINIRNIASIRRFIDLDTAKLLASSLVLTHLDYSNSILCGLPKKSLMNLQRIQNWAAKVVLHRDKYSSSTEALIILHWLPIKERIDYKVLCLIYKCINGMAPEYLTSLLKIKIYARQTRASKQGITLEIPKYKKARFAARSFSVYGPQLWNSLPSHIHLSSTYSVFKKRVKTELFNRAFNSDANSNK